MRRLLPYLAYAYVTAVGATSRWKIEGLEHRERLRGADRRFIYALWHQRQLLMTWTHRDDPVSILVSRSRDGSLIADTLRLSRMGTCRGSSSRGAVVATREMIDCVASGLDLAITPDGPKGPAREVKPGILYLAQKLGIPILPITSASSLRLEFGSWDRFQVPLPFGRAVLRYGEPLAVSEGDDLEAKARELKTRLDRITEEAERSARS